MAELPEIGAVILSGGRSRRFGAPKILQRFLGENFLLRIYRNLADARFSPRILVLGFQAEELRTRLKIPADLILAVNPRPERGQFSSIQTGLAQLAENGAQPVGALICLVDQPHLSARTYLEMRSLAEEHPERAIVPTYGGRGGHPVYLPSRLFPVTLQAPENTTLRDILRRPDARTLRAELPDPGILEDIDTPEDLARLESRLGGSD